MLCTRGVSGTGKRKLEKHFSVNAHFGKGFCPTRPSVNMLAEGHCKVHYGSIKFTYNRKEKAEYIEWTKKNINNKITVYLQRHLKSKSITSSEVEQVQVVVRGDHGDTAFGESVSVDLIGNKIINFEVSVCELFCCKDTANQPKAQF